MLYRAVIRLLLPLSRSFELQLNPVEVLVVLGRQSISTDLN